MPIQTISFSQISITFGNLSGLWTLQEFYQHNFATFQINSNKIINKKALSLEFKIVSSDTKIHSDSFLICLNEKLCFLKWPYGNRKNVSNKNKIKWNSIWKSSIEIPLADWHHIFKLIYDYIFNQLKNYH